MRNIMKSGEHGLQNRQLYWSEEEVILTEKDEFCNYIRMNESAMYYLAFSLVGNESDVEDVISESIYRAYKNYHSLKNKKAFKTWMLRIVYNTAVELIRRDSRMVPVEKITDNAGEDIREEITTRIAVREAVESLKQPYRTVTILFYYDNLTIAEIAQVTNTKIVTVKQQLSRSRKMLLEILKEDFRV